MKSGSKVVLTYGTFDLFHVGHARLLQRLKDLGDLLYVGVSTDDFNQLKGKRCVMPYEHRAEIVSANRNVDFVFPENNWEQKRHDILKYGVSVFAMGDDWWGHFDDLGSVCQVVYLPRTSGVSTSEIKSALSVFDSGKIAELSDAISLVSQVVKDFR